MAPQDRFIANSTVPVRYAETDAMGIVHHSNYIVYFELGRVNFLKSRGGDYVNMVAEGYYLTVAEVQARYLAPARFGQTLVVHCWVDELQSRSLTFGYEIADSAAGTVHCTGQSRHVCITHDGRVARIPEAWAKLISS